MTTIIKTFTARNRNFTIVKDDEGFYLAIEDKYITDGKTNTALNGLQMSASKDLNQCLTMCNNKVDTDYYLSQGMTKSEAFAKVFNLPMTPALENLFA